MGILKGMMAELMRVFIIVILTVAALSLGAFIAGFLYDFTQSI